MNSAANDFSQAARKNDLFDLAAIKESLDRQKPSAPESEKYIVFSLGEDFYAVASKQVAEIIRPLAAAPLPKNAPQWILGIANLRGEIVPVVDLQNLLSGENSRTPKSKFLILRPANLLFPQAGAVAFAVDKLNEIVSLSTEQIEPHEDSSAPGIFGKAAYKSTVARIIDAKNLFALMSI